MVCKALPDNRRMTLHYLEFDYSEDAEGTGTWDAIASVGDAHLPALLAEIVSVLAWAEAEFPAQRAPIEDGGRWDYDLQSEPEHAALQSLHYDAATRQLVPPMASAGGARHTLTLSLSGDAAFGAAFRSRFDLS